PSRGPLSPCARRTSAARAAASESSGSTLMKALSRSRSRMRARQARVSSSLETLLPARARASWATVWSIMGEGSRGSRTAAGARRAVRASLDDFGHQVQAGLDLWCRALVQLPPVAFRHRVFTQWKDHILRVSHGCYPARVDLLHRFDQPEDSGEFTED